MTAKSNAKARSAARAAGQAKAAIASRDLIVETTCTAPTPCRGVRITCPDGSEFFLQWDTAFGGLKVGAERTGDGMADGVTVTPDITNSIIITAKACR